MHVCLFSLFVCLCLLNILKVNAVIANVKNNVTKLVENLKMEKPKKIEIENVALKSNGVAAREYAFVSFFLYNCVILSKFFIRKIFLRFR